VRYDNVRKVRGINNGTIEREARGLVELITVTDPTGKDLRYSISSNRIIEVRSFASLKTSLPKIKGTPRPL